MLINSQRFQDFRLGRGETPSIELYGREITLDNSKITQLAYYNYINNFGEIYSGQHANLSGSKLTLVEAEESVSLINDSYIYMAHGDVEIKAKDINLDDSDIINSSMWPVAAKAVSLINLDAQRNITLTDSTIYAKTLSEFKRAKVNLEGVQLDSSNSLVAIIDQRKGETGSMNLDFSKSITMDRSQIVSMGEARLTTDTNGNDINVKTKDLTMKDSLIGGIIHGDGKDGVTKLNATGAISLEGSYIGGLDEPLGSVAFQELMTDGTIGQSDNLGNGKEVGIPSGHGEIQGDNLYHSFKALDLSSGQVAVLDIPEEVNNVFIRITSGEASLLNGVITSNRKGLNITLINEQGFELGPDTGFDTFSGIRLGAVDAIAFKDGSSFGGTGALEGQLSDGEAIYEMAPERLTGSIKLFGASLKDYVADEGAGQSDISLYGNVVDMTTSAVTTIGGADINLQANALSMTKFAGLEAISPRDGEGGDIEIGADDLILNESGIRTTSLGGQGGDVNIDVNRMNATDAQIEANNYHMSGVRTAYQTGDINITARDSFINEMLYVGATSYTPGGAGNLNINAGTFIGDGPDWIAATELWIMAYKGKTGEIKINADTFDAKQVRMINVAQSDSALKLHESEKVGYGDITINAKDINLEKFVVYTGTKKNREPTTIGDVKINAENEIIIGQIKISEWEYYGPGSGRPGMGGDLDFTAKNILSRQDPLKMDPLYYPTIAISGRVSFQAEENLELGVMDFVAANSNPGRELVHEFKANNITFGIEVGDQSVSTDMVMFDYPDNTEMDHRMIISASGDLRFLSGVNMTVPALSVAAKNFDINNSEITVGGTFGSELAVQDTLSLRGGSYIESLSPSGKSSKAADPVSINISSQQLVLEPDSYIVATNHGGDTTHNRSIADLNIQSGEISLEDAFISTKSTNAAKAGDLEVAATNIALDEDSRIGSYSFSKGESGDITIGSSRLTMSGGSAVESGLDQVVLEGEERAPYAAGDSGDIKITSGVMHLEEGSYVRNAQIDNALSGSVSITSDELKLKGKSFVSTETIQLYQSNYSSKTETDQNGSVDITSKVFEIQDSSYVKTTTVIPMRNAGDITIDTGSLELSGNSSLLSNTEPNAYDIEQGIKDSAYGDAGSLEITAQSLKLADRSKISSDSFTSGDGGNVVINTGDLGLENHSAIYAGSLSTGDGGKIEINAANMTLADKSAVVADVRASGQGGSIGIKLEEMNLDNSLIFGSTTGSGKGSSITVESGSISLLNGARIESAASGAGSAGALDIQSVQTTIAGLGEGFDPKDIEGGETGEQVASGLVTSTSGSGDAGTIRVSGASLELSEGLVSSSSVGEGEAGSIELNLGERLALDDGSSVSVSSSQADGGDIRVSTDGEVRLAGSELTASAAGDGGSVRLLGSGNVFMTEGTVSAEAGQDGGNIEISFPQTLVLQRSGLVANAIQGNGGNISIVAEGFLPSRESVISASSEFGLEGSIEIETPETDVGSGLVVLPESLVEAEINLSDRCALMLSGDVSSFFLNGDGGVPVWSRVSYVPSVFLGDEEEE